MRKRAGIVLSVGTWALVTLLVVGCNQPPPPPAPKAPPFMPIVDIKLLMSGIVDPAADGVWESVAIHIDKHGEVDKQPRTEEEWTAVRNHAMTLAESANLMMIAPRAKDDGEWMTLSRGLLEAAAKSYEATLNKDVKALLYDGADIDIACENCHMKYLPKDPAN